MTIARRGEDQPLALGAAWIIVGWGLWNSPKLCYKLTLKINKPYNCICNSEGGCMLSWPYLKLSVLQTMYTSKEEIAHMTAKSNTD